MANVLYIPNLLPVKFYEISPVQFAQYLSRHFDDYPFTEQIYPWQEPTNYAQKWQNSDPIKLQFQSTFDPLQIDIINKYGNSVATFSGILKVPNKYVPGTFVYEFSISLASIDPGCYHLKLTNGNDAELHMVSEPLFVHPKHEGTVLMEYRNTRFAGDVVFETGIRFSFRVEGAFGFLAPGANIEAYENQKADPQILSARPFRVWPLTIGGSRGVPDWVIEKFHLIFCCNDVWVDGKSYARSGESEITYNEIENYPMRGATLELREGINRGSKIVSPTVDTNKKIVIVGNIETLLFGDTSLGGSSNVIQIPTAG
jgi:hypothetical protein